MPHLARVKMALALASLELSLVTAPRLWTTTPIDYSAANKYCSTYYGRSSYFPRDVSIEPIYDGRHGVLDDDDGKVSSASLSSCGFSLCTAPSSVTNWGSLKQLSEIYLPELRKVIIDAYADSAIVDVIFWNPMLRGEGWTADGDHVSRTETARTGIASMAHLDTDLIVFDGDADALARLIERNRVEALMEGQPAEGAPLTSRGRALTAAIRDGRRFAIVNAWRNIDEAPIGRAPLAVLATRYPSGGSVVPEAVPCEETSRWYAYPHMRADEVLLFTQYDRHIDRPADTWHCALPAVADADAPRRRSFELRCFVVFEESVERSADRFAARPWRACNAG